MDFKYKEHFRYLSNICLNLTDACNYQCRYCFVEQNPHFMTYEVAKAATDYILANYYKKKEMFPENGNITCSITYFGGEPTLCWDSIIVPLTNYIRDNNFPISLSMTTNASLLNKERLNWMKEKNIGMLLSMDGDRFTQEFNRPCRDSSKSSFDLTANNIPYILETHPNITYRATIFAPTVKYTFDNYIYAMNQGFKNIFFMPDARNPWSEQQKQELRNELNEIYSYMSFCFTKGILPPMRFKTIEKSFFYILKHDIKVLHNDLQIEKKSNDIMRCGLGTTLGSIGYDGSIYGCQEQTSQGLNSIFYIGNIFNGGIDQQKHEALLKAYYEPSISECENKELCKECLLKTECKDICCPSTGYDLFQKFHQDSEIHCLWNRWMLNNSIVLMEKYVKENNQAFKTYLYDYCRYGKMFREEGV